MKYLSYLLLCCFYLSCVPVNQTSAPNFVPKKIIYSDYRYDSSVGSYIIYSDNVLSPPITTLRSRELLTLEFDVFGEEYESLYAKLIHCNANWTKSSINDLEFLDQNNEFPINNYDFSGNALKYYTHYTFRIPRVRLSGNYILAVYRDGNQEDLLLTKRFMVVENIAPINADITRSNIVDQRNNSQLVDFDIDYNSVNVKNPNTEFKIMIRQNKRWDNAKFGLKPTNILFGQKIMEFNYFGGENSFLGGNEFRFFDLRTITQAGINVAKLDVADNRRFAIIATSKVSDNVVYSQPINQDLNGQYFNTSLEPTAGPLDADYLYTSFTLIAPKDVYGKIYVIGEFNDWQAVSKNAMYFDETLNAYRYDVILKQGYYNYTFYAPENSNPYPVDGSYFETENDYDIIVYHRELGTYFDRIVGYKSFSSND